jgi:hypothetical protein
MHRFASLRCGDWLHAAFRPESRWARLVSVTRIGNEKTAPDEKLRSWLDHCTQMPQWAGSPDIDRHCRPEFGDSRYESFIGSKSIAQADLAIQLNAASSEA